jgi:hypothetical protein
MIPRFRCRFLALLRVPTLHKAEQARRTEIERQGSLTRPIWPSVLVRVPLKKIRKTAQYGKISMTKDRELEEVRVRIFNIFS